MHATKNLDPIEAFTDARPIHTCHRIRRPGMLDDAFWQEIHDNARQHRAYLTTAHHEVQSYWSTVGQSGREDYHREYAVLYGMTALFPTATKGSLSFGRAVELLNAITNVNEGKTQTYRKEVVIEFDAVPGTVAVFSPLTDVQRVLAVLDTCFAPLGLRFGQVPRWSPRIQTNGTVYRLRQVTVQRPSVTEYVEVTEPVEAKWENPNVIDGGFTFLPDTPHYNFKAAGCEGLSIVVTDEQVSAAEWDGGHGTITVPVFHIIQWITARRRSGRWGKKPLAIMTCHDMDEDEAISEMHQIAAAMGRAARYQGDLLPWQAAAMAAEFDDLPPLLTGSHEWLAKIADQRESGETYRNRGAGPDA